MKNLFFSLLFVLGFSIPGSSQSNISYEVQLNPIQINGLSGLHSYAFAQDANKWLIIGGRRDGLHARQPFNAFPASQNNDSIYVIDIVTQQFWSASLNSLPIGMKEQLQSTNMNFYQDNDSLYIIGGYGYSNTAVDHITYPNLTSVQVSGLMNAIVNQASILTYFKQITNQNMAITGGQLGKLGNTFYLVGGHRFDGRYNPMGHNTYTQTYSNQIRKFELNNSGSSITVSNYSAITDAVHLRRRDYNLLPQIFPDGTEGYTISSGVFQSNVDLPFLYPVDITSNGHFPNTGFNQYLSNYHSAKACFYDSLNNEMHSLFFGGMSQYYYQNGTLIQDNNVPFVKTISRITRYADSSLSEFQLATEMPNFKGASAEFIINQNLPHTESEVIKISDIQGDTISIGHIFGGILSNSLNPFGSNQTSTTSADPSIYEVILIRQNSTSINEIKDEGRAPLRIFPNPAKAAFTASINLANHSKVYYFLSNTLGQVITEGELRSVNGMNEFEIEIPSEIKSQNINFTLIVDDVNFYTEKISVVK